MTTSLLLPIPVRHRTFSVLLLIAAATLPLLASSGCAGKTDAATPPPAAAAHPATTALRTASPATGDTRVPMSGQPK